MANMYFLTIKISISIEAASYDHKNVCIDQTESRRVAQHARTWTVGVIASSGRI